MGPSKRDHSQNTLSAATINPELNILPKMDMGPEDAMHLDLLPNLAPSGGHNCVMKAQMFFQSTCSPTH